ncbi:MAG: indole-3-glycerol phosphate synthase TrpC [Synergistaceae bacterium]|nr:indole-3-glycerol phosphate synthase TrpC [Synergistaceae bacterium]
MTILDEIAAYTRKRVEAAKEKISLSELKDKAFSIEKGDFPFERALRRPRLSFILECKKASPSKGIIAENFEPLKIAKDYEKIGADSVSVLTEPKYFLGRDEYLKEIAGEIKIPVLRKDFTVDEYMLYEAKILGASAVLLIVSILSEKQLGDYLKICNLLGLSALVEVHDENEAKIAVSSGAKIIGVNNRNLKDFSVDTRNSANLREKIPAEILFVSESGVKNSDDIKNLINIGADAVLIGETMMKAEDKQAAFSMLKKGLS